MTCLQVSALHKPVFVTLGKSHTPQLKPITRQRFLMPFGETGHVLGAQNAVMNQKHLFSQRADSNSNFLTKG